MITEVNPSQTKIGWVGTGVMGRWMCQHVMDLGYTAMIFTRTKSKADPLLKAGATWADSPAEVAENSDIIFTIVGFPEDVRHVYLGENGILTTAKSGSIIVDMTTTEPSLAIEVYQTAQAQGISSIDAPVSGGDVGAREARLAIMIGGDQKAVDAIHPLFEAMGQNIVYQGKAGSGQHTKMCNQITISGTMIGVCEALLYGAKAGLDLEIMLSTISKGAAACWSLDNLAPRVLKRNFDPGFFVEHFIKDMGIALDEAKRMGISLPGLSLVHQLYLATQAQGHGRLGTHALMLALEQLSSVS
ncbi:TPA: NAD(P)-dependent oxidoreductase [Candidatus Poribacteria bacterium]|nr:NAD(P)-dependent oxidoreductase [Candidatus Poribacteria bacterium]HIB88768.1 NAD(P)-dependent oxidoreductase [Candidatus Poribacteria bacterium]HIC00318.1 NAD(P)-dependent oxidoreductase [Candidatus Poribacteria bacterium]HIN32055.1 NAD(P)-dependent oxidoreductase [Candidatus Poribacteria bacterium]HIO05948.1 NAD(P)-dependent oxidoreductase [Candidatus Poribacteria bacterium]